MSEKQEARRSNEISSHRTRPSLRLDRSSTRRGIERRVNRFMPVTRYLCPCPCGASRPPPLASIYSFHRLYRPDGLTDLFDVREIANEETRPDCGNKNISRGSVCSGRREKRRARREYFRAGEESVGNEMLHCAHDSTTRLQCSRKNAINRGDRGTLRRAKFLPR